MPTETVQNRAPAPKKKKKRPPIPIPLGEVLNGYKLTKVVGRGGMGTVYLGEHELLGRKSAIKVLAKSFWHDNEFVSRFFSEAQVATKINHPNIVDILDFIHEENPRRIAYIMELVKGPTLKACLAKHRFTLAQSINVSAQLASALREAHLAGVIHRDLKPANILVVEPLDSDLSILPSIKLLDFGIAKITSGQVNHQTMQGTVLGTPKYMAPEQISAEPVSSATDIYALGEIFFEMVTGQRIFNGPNKVIMAHKLSGQIPKLECPPEIPGRSKVIELTTACLHPNPDKRISIEEFSAALKSLRENTDIDSSLPITRRRQSWTADDLPADSNPKIPVHSQPEGPVTTQTNNYSQTQEKKPPMMLIATFVLIAVTFVAAYSLLQPQKSRTNIGQPVQVEKDALPSPAPKKVLSRIIQLTSEPSGATVMDLSNNTQLGTTPYQLKFTDGSTRKLRLILPNHQTFSARITEWANQIHYRLTKLETQPAAVPTVAGESSEDTTPPPKGVAPKDAQTKPAKSLRKKPSKQKANSNNENDDTAPMNRQDMPSW